MEGFASTDQGRDIQRTLGKLYVETTGFSHHAPITFLLRQGSTIGLRSWRRADER
jgi:hypothetical protein